MIRRLLKNVLQAYGGCTEPFGRDVNIHIEISGRNVNNLKYEDDTTLMAESEEELKSLLMRVKE